MNKAISIDNYDYLHILSGEDLPLKSQTYICDFFQKNNGKEFIKIENPCLTTKIELGFIIDSRK